MAPASVSWNVREQFGKQVLDAGLDLISTEPGDVHGKGGVGKTTIAAAVAVALAERGHEAHLSTTDPAAHLTETLGCGAGVPVV